MYKKFVIAMTVLTVFGGSLALAQTVVLQNIPVKSGSPLDELFYDYHLGKVDFQALKATLSTRSQQHNFVLEHPSFRWELEMFEHDVHSGDYVLTMGSDAGIERHHRKPANKSMIGYLRTARGGHASLVYADGFLAGMVEEAGRKLFFEQANAIDPALSPDVLVFYDSEKIYGNPNIECGYDRYIRGKQDMEIHENESQFSGRSHCLQVEIAIANDFSVYQKRGSVANVENWNTTVLTLLQANYDDEFEHSLEFVQSASFVATSTGSDPWNGINNINSHLDKHVQWANGGGYGSAYDVATAWTTKYKNGAVGLAWLGVICSSLRYNVCSDYGGSNNCLKQLQAHELGHNFNANHDAAGNPTIMAPSVNCTNSWSSQSVNAINTHVRSRGCLSICSGGSPPVANFTADPREGCVPLTVQFFDESTNDPTARQWTFPGGTPTSSTQQNPVVTYKGYGQFDVTLKATNLYGNNQVTFKKFIFANSKPIPDFTKVIVERTVYFTNNSFYGGNYEWDFGDGNVSYDINPIHTYDDDGVYKVTLTAENECGLAQVSMNVTIVTIPVALFVADTTTGCAVMIVKFKNLSSTNVTTWEWEFPGGNPSTSNKFEPVVEYAKPGKFDVKLTAKNSKYKAILNRPEYIRVDSIPVADFNTEIQVDTVRFNNLSKYGKNYLWDFGDGASTSADSSPVHVYKPGTYTAILIVKNACGNDTLEQEIKIGSGLNAGFRVDTTNGCIPFEVRFINTSSAASWYRWSFPGGIPDTSSEAEPIVVYNQPGIFDVSLVAGNGNEERIETKLAYVSVQASPEAGFSKAIQQFTAFFNDQSKYTRDYNWDFGDGQSSQEPSPEHTYNAEGEYTVTLIVSNECGLDTIVQPVAIYLIPRVDFVADTTILCGAGFVQFSGRTSSDVHQWNWEFDGASPQSSDIKDPLVYYDKKGIYAVRLAVANSNGNNEIIKTNYIRVLSPVLCPEGYIEPNDVLNPSNEWPLRKLSSAGIRAVPNPFVGKVTLSGSTTGKEVRAKVFDLTGKLIAEQSNVLTGDFNIVFDLSVYPHGTFYIQIIRSEGVTVLPVVSAD
jgi:PKD repeat protein